MASIKIFNFNNYYNRRVILSTDFGTPVYTETGDAVNFNPADGVVTQFTAGRAMNAYNGKGDYLVYFADNVNPTSRWFILDATRTREGQYALTLKRDVAVDFYNAIVSADTFIEKAILPDNNPLIFNKENISVNQIKKAEYLLRDVTQTAWILGYLDRKLEKTTLNLQSMEVIPDIDLGDKDISSWDLYDYVEGFGGNKKLYGKSEANTFYFETLYKSMPSAVEQYQTWINYIAGTISNTSNPNIETKPTDYTVVQKTKFATWIANNKTNIQSIISRYRDLYFDVISQPALYNNTLGINGQVIKAAGTYYKITINQKNNEEFRSTITSDKSGDYLLTWLKNKFNNAPHEGSGSPAFMLQAFYQNLTITLEEIGATTDTYTVDIPASQDRLHLKDAPYDIFCIPYMYGSVNDSFNSTQTEQTKAQVLNIAQSLAQQLGSNLYDLQLVPYSPMTGFEGFYDSGKDRVDLYFKGTDQKRFTYIKTSGGKNAVLMFWATASSGSLSIRLKGITEEVISKKMASECYMARLVSPNYNGQFEFNPAKLDFNPNSLTPTLFNVDFTFIPYNPFIRVSPIFDGLYGSTFTDARGLICGGDFSIAYLSDAWINYQIQNKNYNNIFNREIENLETQYRYQNIMNAANIGAGTLQGAVSGGEIGSLGGPVGAVIGAGVGGLLSAAGGAADYYIAKQLQSETLNYKTDLFGYQLDNIKALPNSIAKTTAYNSINKIFPSLEMYECTDEEKQAVAKKIAWNSMSVGIVDKVENYLGNTFTYGDITDKGYIKGKLIRIDISDDYHLVQDIADELNRGWYFK